MTPQQGRLFHSKRSRECGPATSAPPTSNSSTDAPSLSAGTRCRIRAGRGQPYHGFGGNKVVEGLPGEGGGRSSMGSGAGPGGTGTPIDAGGAVVVTSAQPPGFPVNTASAASRGKHGVSGHAFFSFFFSKWSSQNPFVG